jgi:hypothetical protein
VNSYKSRTFSNPSDKLPAISAIAKEFRGLKRPNYVTGLREKNLVQGLIWERVSKYACKPRPAVYRALTWSWAAMDGQVKLPEVYQLYNFKQQLKLLSIEIHPISHHSPYTAVDSAKLRVRGRATGAKILDGGTAL